LFVPFLESEFSETKTENDPMPEGELTMAGIFSGNMVWEENAPI
jgi:hypothetical protein